MRTDWQGSYLDGRTAARQPVTIRLMREGLEITTEVGGTRLWPYRELRQTQGSYAGEEVRLERGGELPETLLIPEGGVLAATAAIYLWGIPLLAALVTPHVPVAWEETLGRSAVPYLAPPERRCGDPALGAAMDAIVARLLAAGPPSPYTMRVYVVNRPVVNALAAPGGHVVIFHGLLERTATPEELAGVMAHELQHILRRHTTRAVIQDVGTGLLLMALTGDVTGPLAYGLQAARALGELSYSRRAEEEADLEGMKMLLAARVDPAGMIAFFAKIQKEEGTQPKALAYLSSHPMPAERIARLKAMAAARTGPPEPVLPNADWPALIKRC